MLLPVFSLYAWLQHFFRCTSRDLRPSPATATASCAIHPPPHWVDGAGPQRLQTISKSPIYAHLSGAVWEWARAKMCSFKPISTFVIDSCSCPPTCLNATPGSDPSCFKVRFLGLCIFINFGVVDIYKSLFGETIPFFLPPNALR